MSCIHNEGIGAGEATKVFEHTRNSIGKEHSARTSRNTSYPHLRDRYGSVIWLVLRAKHGDHNDLYRSHQTRCEEGYPAPISPRLPLAEIKAAFRNGNF